MFVCISKLKILKNYRLFVVEEKSMHNQSINGRTVHIITMVISVPILLTISALAMAPSSDVQLGYSQQQEANDLSFQNTDVTLDGTIYPVKYNITDNAAEVLSVVADKESFKLIITIAPTKDGKLTVLIPRNLTDYKVAGGKDGKFVVNINAKEVTNFQEVSNNQTTRGLEINFGKDDRVIEVIGTQMGQGDIATVQEQATEMTPTPGAENASQTGANVSQTGASIVNQTGEAAQTFVNKTTSVLGNISGEILGNK
jgi:hypothetical protein